MKKIEVLLKFINYKSNTDEAILNILKITNIEFKELILLAAVFEK